MQDLGLAAILGLVEGITEYLPVSSTGHLIVAGNLLNFSGEKASCFEVFIQLGAILAVLVLYWQRFVGLIPVRGIKWRNEDGFSGVRGIVILALTTIPAVIGGLLAHRFIKEHLFSPITVVWALIVGAIGILIAEKYRPEAKITELDQLGMGQALMIGCFQCLALWPGMSRSACTIVGGLFSGLDRKVAAEYSFLAAVPLMIAATLYDLYKEWHLLEMSDFAFFAIGLVVSFISAAAAVKTFIAIVQKWSLVPFACYRLIIAPIIYFVMK